MNVMVVLRLAPLVLLVTLAACGPRDGDAEYGGVPAAGDPGGGQVQQ